MEIRKIGSLDVSLVGLGCNNFGRRLDASATARVIDASLDAGITLLDTADIYGGTKSEEFLGETLKGRRNRFIVATKFGHEVAPDKKGAHPDYLRRAVEDSLRRLQIDQIDLYQLHTPDESVPIADTLGALNDLIQAGKVREIGCSNFSSQQLEEADGAATGARFVSVQNEYSLIQREPEQGVLATCERLKIGFIPYFPLACGLLTGKYRVGQALPEGTRIEEGSRWLTHLETAERLAVYAESQGHTLLELAMSWLAAQPTVTSIIAGATSAAQVHANATAVSWAITPDQEKDVRAIVTEVEP